MSDNAEQFEQFLTVLSSADIQWLISESNAPYAIPSEHAPEDLIAHKLVTKTMIKSGRNPEYGYAVTQLGRIFAFWVQSRATSQFLKQQGDNDNDR